MTGREFIASESDEKVGNYINDLLAHGQLCKQFCQGCNEAKWDCKRAVKNMLNSEVAEYYK